MPFINWYNVIYLVENMVSNNMLQINVVFTPRVQSKPFATRKERWGGGH